MGSKRYIGARGMVVSRKKDSEQAESTGAGAAAGSEKLLCYVSDELPGIRRKRWGRGFSYFDSEGNRIKNPSVLKRVRGLVIPPAWVDVWICANPQGHIQATGRDQKKRKQYIYHPRWEKIRNQTKFDRLYEFGMALPGIRDAVDADMKKRTLNRERVLAVVVALLDEAKLRIGNPEYRRRNNSYGLTTLRNRHVDVSATKIRIAFKGKRGKTLEKEISNRRLARQIGKCQDLPGQELFQYIDDEERRQPIRSEDVNAYIREISGSDFTAKTFRTWWGTVLMSEELHKVSISEEKTGRGKPTTKPLKQVAEALGNTTTICRKYYIHPVVFEAFEAGILERVFKDAKKKAKETEAPLSRAELAVLDLLRSADASA